MKTKFAPMTIAFLVLFATSCSVNSVQSNVSSRRDGGHPAATTSAEGGDAGQPVPTVQTVQTENGAMLSKDSSEAMKMSGTSSDVVINPGSLTVDTQVSVEDYKRSDPNYIARELGLESGEVEAVGVTQVKGSTTDSLAKPMTITLEIGSNLLELFLSEPYYFVICTARKAGQSPKVWTIASEDIVVTGNFLQFQTKEFGVFEVFKAYRRVTKIKQMKPAAMNAFAEPLAVSGLSTSALGTGKSVSIDGENLGDDTRVLIGDHPATVTAYSPEQVSFTVPDFDEFGFQTLKIMNRYNTIIKDVFYKGSKNDLPLMAQLPREVCKGTAYYNLQGTKLIGTKVCDLANARLCTASIKDNCVMDASYRAVDTASVQAGDLSVGYSLAGVSGAFDLLPSTTACSQDGQEDCRASAAYKAADKSTLLAAHIRKDVAIAGTVGTFPLPRPTCSQAETVGCNIPPGSNALVAVDSSQIDARNIRNTITIGGQTGTYPSAGNPLAGSSFASFDSAIAETQLASSQTFEFYDREGNRYEQQGDADLIAENIVSNTTLWGVTGSYKLDSPTADGSDLDYRWGYAYKDMTSGKVKTNCRSLVPATSTNLPENNIAGSLTDEPTQNPWGDEKFACKDEGWTVFTPNCWTNSQSSATRCLVQDRKTLLMWTTAGLLDGTAEQAQAHCDNLNYQGQTDWRVPTQKEAMQAVINGISSLTPDLFRFSNGQRIYWTSTVPHDQATEATPEYWNIDMTSGMISTTSSGAVHYLCVRGG